MTAIVYWKHVRLFPLGAHGYTKSFETITRFCTAILLENLLSNEQLPFGLLNG